MHFAVDSYNVSWFRYSDTSNVLFQLHRHISNASSFLFSIVLDNVHVSHTYGLWYIVSEKFIKWLIRLHLFIYFKTSWLYLYYYIAMNSVYHVLNSFLVFLPFYGLFCNESAVNNIIDKDLLNFYPAPVAVIYCIIIIVLLSLCLQFFRK